MHASLSHCTILTKPKFKGKIAKNFKTTAAQVTCPWSILVLVKRLWMCQNNYQGESKRKKNAQLGFQNRRVWTDLGMPAFVVLLCLTLATYW